MDKNTLRSVSLLSDPERLVAQIASLEDRELLARIDRLVQRERFATVSLVAHLAEMDRRRLYLERGYSSLFTYCTRALHLSEHAAYKRMEAARLARRFPVLLARLVEGDLHLSAVVLLGPVLTKGNHEALIEEARHKSKREVEEIVARVRPAGPVPSLVQRLPAQQVPVGPAPPAAAAMAEPDRRESVMYPAPVPVAPPAMSATSPPRWAPPPRPILAPLAPGSYKVQFTAGAEMHDRLLRAQALLRHRVPDGDIAKVLDLALIALLEKTEARKIGKRKRAAERRKARRSGEEKLFRLNEEPDLERRKLEVGLHEGGRERPRSRHVPADVRREVWERDQGRCTFTSAAGVRCAETGFLEFDHREPYACGGRSTAENLRLTCRRHNQYWAQLRFGSDKTWAREESPVYGGFWIPLRL